MNRLSAFFLAAALSANAVSAEEPHVDAVVRDVLAAAAKVKAASPDAVPMAFWDFDGTILKGDMSTGWLDVNHRGAEVYTGLFRACAEAGFSGVYTGSDGAGKFLYDDYPRLRGIGRWLALPAMAQVFKGADEVAMGAFCRRHAAAEFGPWVFASSRRILDDLSAAGVENYVISASPEIFVKAACPIAGIPSERGTGMKTAVAGGRITDRILYPLPMNEGKVDVLREVLRIRPGAVAVAAFGNSYPSDGPFMRYVATSALPGGARGVAVMINGGEAPAEFAGLFRCVEQTATVGQAAAGKGR